MPYKDPKKNREYQKQWAKQRRKDNKEKAFVLVGDICAHCGLSDKRVLEFDHIIPIMRRTSGVDSSTELARDIASGKIDPKTMQTLCANCHTIKTYYS